MYVKANSVVFLLAALAATVTHVVATGGTETAGAMVQGGTEPIVKNLAPELEDEDADLAAHHKKCHKKVCPSINPTKCCKKWGGYGWCQSGVCHCGKHCSV
ncbi:hypothetical protein N7526_001905 [Penicillium atrosanguineum]|nr:hypothetical protein N7526_001905 [Penicillium atrosanguineum]